MGTVATTRLSSKGQVVIPGDVRKALGLEVGAQFVVMGDGDTVVLIKELKLKGGGGAIKIGTKVKNIRLVEGDHDIDCKIDGQGMMLKSQFVKKG